MILLNKGDDTMTKKKRKLKKKALAIITVTLIIILLVPLLFLNKNAPKASKKESKKTKELGDIAKKIDFYKDDYTDRYLAYKKANPNLSNEKVIVNVNIGLDYPYYENVQKTKFEKQAIILKDGGDINVTSKNNVTCFTIKYYKI